MKARSEMLIKQQKPESNGIDYKGFFLDANKCYRGIWLQ